MSDYGYFGDGSTGYAHYMTTVNQTHGSGGGGGNGGGKGGGCFTATIMAITVIAAVIAIPLVCIFC